jgi:hypothetical protein
MKIFLKQTHSSLYFQKLDAWTSCYQDALDFREARKAIDFAHRYEINDVQVVVMIADTSHAQLVPFEMPAQPLARPVPAV